MTVCQHLVYSLGQMIPVVQAGVQLCILQVILMQLGAAQAAEAATSSCISHFTKNGGDISINHGFLQLVVDHKSSQPGRDSLDLLEKVTLLQHDIFSFLYLLKPDWPAIECGGGYWVCPDNLICLLAPDCRGTRQVRNKDSSTAMLASSKSSGTICL